VNCNCRRIKEFIVPSNKSLRPNHNIVEKNNKNYRHPSKVLGESLPEDKVERRVKLTFKRHEVDDGVILRRSPSDLFFSENDIYSEWHGREDDASPTSSSFTEKSSVFGNKVPYVHSLLPSELDILATEKERLNKICDMLKTIFINNRNDFKNDSSVDSSQVEKGKEGEKGSKKMDVEYVLSQLAENFDVLDEEFYVEESDDENNKLIEEKITDNYDNNLETYVDNNKQQNNSESVENVSSDFDLIDELSNYKEKDENSVENKDFFEYITELANNRTSTKINTSPSENNDINEKNENYISLKEILAVSKAAFKVNEKIMNNNENEDEVNVDNIDKDKNVIYKEEDIFNEEVNYEDFFRSSFDVDANKEVYLDSDEEDFALLV
jgi:hypothetical protein